MKFIAKTDGFVGGVRVRQGETFEFMGSRPGKWMQPVTEAAQEKPAKKDKEPKEPTTFSEMAKRDSKALEPKKT